MEKPLARLKNETARRLVGNFFRGFDHLSFVRRDPDGHARRVKSDLEKYAMQNQNKVLCPTCKIEMNHHTLINERRRISGRLKATADFTGILEEFHSCPNCGATMTHNDQPAK